MKKTPNEQYCSIERSLSVLGERWTLLILREAFNDVTRFVDFRDGLGIAPDVLSDRLTTLVEGGIMERSPYQEPGSRARFSYHLTDAGNELKIVVGALQQWGDDHMPLPTGPTIERKSRKTGRPLSVRYVDDRGKVVDESDVDFIRTAAYPTAR